MSSKNKTPITSGLGYSDLTENIYWGKQNTEKRMWVGDKKDVTQQFIGCLFQYLPAGFSRSISTGKDTSCFLHVKQTKEGLEKAAKAIEKMLSELESNTD